MRDIFFSVQDIFLRGYFLARLSFLYQNQSAGYFFSEITHNLRQKSDGWPLSRDVLSMS